MMVIKTILSSLQNGVRSLRSSQRGVTLTELSVSVSIISLMVAGSFGGLSMLKAAKIRKAVSEFTTYMSAINEFQSEYGYLPGDLPTASDYWTGAHNGDGNSLVDSTNEDLYAWEHLGKSALITGTYTGAVSGTRYAAGVNSINSEPFTIGVFSFYAYQTLIYNTAGHALRLGSITSGWPTAGFMLAKDAYAIDAKIDDGLAANGMFYAARGAAGSSNNCVTDTTNLYNPSDTSETCTLYYWQRKF